MKHISSIICTLIILCSISTKAQFTEKCGTDILEERLSLEEPAFRINLEQAQTLIEKQIALNKQTNGNTKTSGIVYTVPVVVHVIYDNYRDNISRAQIEDALRVLNEDFRRLNSDANQTRSIFQGVAADVEVEFKLAKKDPNGACTDGINRIQSNLTVDASDNVKSLSIWPNDEYMNIWTVRTIDIGNSSVPGIVLGYAYRPRPNQSGITDGLVVRHDRMGTIGTAKDVSLGRTLTHEVGHYLGLLHPFNRGCNVGDGAADTPPVAQANFGCNLNANSCSNDNPDLPDMIENYMDYADDNCTNLFTIDQKNIMRASLTNAALRANIKSSSNLIATGITNPPACTPTALFSADRTVICEGGSVSFSNQTEDGDPDTYQWTFQGGNPGASSSPNPAVTYPFAGVFDVSLTVSNSAGSDTKTIVKQINVKQNLAGFYPTWSQDFEGATVPKPEISFEDEGDGRTFELFTSAGSSGTQSLKLDNFNTTVDGELDAVISPAITTIFTQNLSLSFDYAFAAKANNNDDKLEIYVSDDCGATWTFRRFFRGPQLRTGALLSGSAYVPAANEWKTQTITFDAFVSNNPIFIKFEFEAGGGNNFYLDNIRFSGTIGQEENELLKRFEVYPNPAKGNFKVAFETQGNEDLTLELLALDGKKIETRRVTVNQQSFLDFNTDLPAGIYILKATIDGAVLTRKLVIE